MLNGLAGDAAQSLFISIPVVAISMGIEAAFLDGVLFRVLMKESVKRRFVWMLIANMMNASIASAIGLAYVVHHPTTMIATATY
jgi:3-oxoacyl-(acyl-carrier-protein) synthase